jgi:hypothetical protein
MKPQIKTLIGYKIKNSKGFIMIKIALKPGLLLFLVWLSRMIKVNRLMIHIL